MVWDSKLLISLIIVKSKLIHFFLIHLSAHIGYFDLLIAHIWVGFPSRRID